MNLFAQIKRLYLIAVLLIKDCLYSFVYSNQEKIRIYPYDPKSKAVAANILTRIQKLKLNLPVHFVGSSSLKIAGVRDIDFLIECPKTKLKLVEPKLTQLWKCPVKIKSELIEWVFVSSGFEVEILLIDPESIIYKRDINIFNLLNQNREYLHKYEQLKFSLNGKSLRQYDLAKSKFLKSVPGYWNF
jgi:hypothetical protein